MQCALGSPFLAAYFEFYLYNPEGNFSQVLMGIRHLLRIWSKAIIFLMVSCFKEPSKTILRFFLPLALKEFRRYERFAVWQLKIKIGKSNIIS
jgi:hypothetical protein